MNSILIELTLYPALVPAVEEWNVRQQVLRSQLEDVWESVSSGVLRCTVAFAVRFRRRCA